MEPDWPPRVPWPLTTSPVRRPGVLRATHTPQGRGFPKRLWAVLAGTADFIHVFPFRLVLLRTYGAPGRFSSPIDRFDCETERGPIAKVKGRRVRFFVRFSGTNSIFYRPIRSAEDAEATRFPVGPDSPASPFTRWLGREVQLNRGGVAKPNNSNATDDFGARIPADTEKFLGCANASKIRGGLRFCRPKTRSILETSNRPISGYTRTRHWMFFF